MTIAIIIFFAVISVIWFFLAYLRYQNSPMLDEGGKFALPDYFTFEMLLVAGGISTMLFLIQLFTYIMSSYN